MGGLSAVLTAIGAGAAGIITACALVIKTRNEGKKPMQVLRRLVDWLEGNTLMGDVPPTLRADITELMDGDEDE